MDFVLYLTLLAFLSTSSHASPTGNQEFVKRQEGGDISSNDITLDYPVAPPSTKRSAALGSVERLEKRLTYRILNTCPDKRVPAYETDFRGSQCTSGISPQAYTISCNQPDPNGVPGPPAEWYDNDCNNDEICVQYAVVSDTAWQSRQYSLAYCVSEYVTRLIPEALPGYTQRRMTSNIVPGDNTAQLSLTGQNDNTVLFKATDITAIARDANNASLTDAIACADCGVLKMWNIPSGAANLDINITFPNPTDVAYLESFSWPLT